MSYQYEEDDYAKEEWKRQLLESRQRARDALSECSRPGIDNWGAVNAPELVQFLHAQTMDYYRHVRPKRDGLPQGMWDDTLTQVSVPKSQRVDAGRTDWYGDYELGNLLDEVESTKKPVSLETLEEEWQQDCRVVIQAEVEHRATGETITESQHFSLHLPPAACDAIISRLDDCLENLRWLPEAGEISIGADDIEVHQ